MKANKIAFIVGHIARIGFVIGLSSVCWTAAAQSNAKVKQIQLSHNELPGYSLFYEGERDWTLFTAEMGAPAPCLQSKPAANGTEQIWRRSGSEANPLKGRVRIDYAVFESAGEASSAANAAALLSNNATAKIEGERTVGDAAWRTVGGSIALIVQRGPAVIYLSGQGDESISESDLAAVAGRVMQKVDSVQWKISAKKLACDIETYLGLNLIQSQVEKMKSIAQDLSRGGADSRRAARELTSIVRAESPNGIRREAALNLVRAARSLGNE